MFKNRSLQVQMVKTNKQKAADESTECHHFDPELINEIIKDQVQHTAMLVGVALAARVVLNTVSEIAIITAKAKIR